MHGFFDTAECCLRPCIESRRSSCRVLSVLNRPARTRRYRRFADTLAGDDARLAVEGVVGLSILPDFHRLPFRQLAWRTYTNTSPPQSRSATARTRAPSRT